MKKIAMFAVCIAAVACLALCLGACSKKSQEPVLLGGWTLADSPAVTDEVQGLMDKALEGFAGARYIPAAYVASQVVAGTNHLLVCRVAPVIPDAVETWALVTLYQDPQNEVTISDVKDSGVRTYMDANGLVGSWAAPESPAITKDLAKLFENATKDLTDAKIAPVALLATQVVSGTNYLVLASVTPTDGSDAEPHFALVTVYANLQGNASITGNVDFAE